MMKLWPIAANAFTQSIRQVLYTVVLLLTFGTLVFTLFTTGYSMEVDMVEGDTRLMMDFGLSTIMCAVLLVAAFAASTTLANEIERRTVLTVVTKPVSRTVILVGKFLGTAGAVTVAWSLMSVVFLLTVRHGVLSRASTDPDMPVIVLGLSAAAAVVLAAGFCNFFFGWQVTGTIIGASLVAFTAAGAIVGFIGKDWSPVPFGYGINPQLAYVLVLIWMAAMILTALAVAVSSRLGQLATLGVCVGAFMLALVTEPLLGAHADQNHLAAIAYRVVPNLAYFFTVDSLTTGLKIDGQYMLLAAGYAACYVGAFVLIGIALFQTREMDARENTSTAPGMINTYAWMLRVVSLIACGAGLVNLTSTTRGGDGPWAYGAIAGGAIGWLLAGRFGRGSRWAMRLVMLLSVSQLALSVTFLIFLHPTLVDPVIRLGLLVVAGIQVGYVALMRLRRPTRAHFGYLRV